MRSEMLRWGGELDEALLTAIVDFTIRVGSADLLPKFVSRGEQDQRKSIPCTSKDRFQPKCGRK